AHRLGVPGGTHGLLGHFEPLVVLGLRDEAVVDAGQDALDHLRARQGGPPRGEPRRDEKDPFHAVLHNTKRHLEFQAAANSGSSPISAGSRPSPAGAGNERTRVGEKPEPGRSRTKAIRRCGSTGASSAKRTWMRPA